MTHPGRGVSVSTSRYHPRERARFRAKAAKVRKDRQEKSQVLCELGGPWRTVSHDEEHGADLEGGDRAETTLMRSSRKWQKLFIMRPSTDLDATRLPRLLGASTIAARVSDAR